LNIAGPSFSTVKRENKKSIHFVPVEIYKNAKLYMVLLDRYQ
jgi:hypothetical protein